MLTLELIPGSVVLRRSGAFVAPPADVTAPTITSGNSSSAVENIAVGGTVTANEPASFGVTGADAAFVTINAGTGVWSISTPDYEAKTSYSWTFTATDGSGNVGQQAYTHTVTNDVADDPPTSGISAPIIAQTSADGASPFNWSINFPDSTIAAGMFLRTQTSADGLTESDGSYTTPIQDLVQQLFPDDFEDPIVIAGFVTPEDTFYLQQRIEADDGPDTFVSPWSNELTETIVPPAGVDWTPQAAPPIQNIGYGSSAATFTNQVFGVGLGIIKVARTGVGVMSGVTVNGVAATLVTGASIVSGSDVNQIYQIPIATAGSYSVVVTGTNVHQFCAIHVGTLTGASATRTAVATKAFGFEGNPLSTGAITLPANGIILAMLSIGNSNGTNAVWASPAVEDGEAIQGTGYQLSSAYLQAAGTPTVSGENAQYSGMVAAAWELA